MLALSIVAAHGVTSGLQSRATSRTQQQDMNISSSCHCRIMLYGLSKSYGSNNCRPMQPETTEAQPFFITFAFEFNPKILICAIVPFFLRIHPDGRSEVLVNQFWATCSHFWAESNQTNADFTYQTQSDVNKCRLNICVAWYTLRSGSRVFVSHRLQPKIGTSCSPDLQTRPNLR